MLDSIFSEEENATAFVFATIILKIWSFCLSEMTISRWMEGGIFCDIRKSLTHARIWRSEIHHKNMSPHKQETKDLSSELSTRDSHEWKLALKKLSLSFPRAQTNNFNLSKSSLIFTIFLPQYKVPCGYGGLFTSSWRPRISLIRMEWQY